MKTRIGSIIAAIVVLAATTAGGCGDKDDEFTRDCKVKGGHVVTQKRDGSTSRICLPPSGGWQ